jgi:tRNA(Met) C34 N-acetyltransferase TmcA
MKGERKVHEERWATAAAAAAGSVPPRALTGRPAGALTELPAAGSVPPRALTGRPAGALTELTLTTPIRYAAGDAVEEWLNTLLCFDAEKSSARIVDVMPPPAECELYVVNRDA